MDRTPEESGVKKGCAHRAASLTACRRSVSAPVFFMLLDIELEEGMERFDVQLLEQVSGVVWPVVWTWLLVAGCIVGHR